MLIKANDIQINYKLSGRKNAPVVVLSHSLGSSLVMWDPQMEALEPDFQVLRYDTRGHGGSEASGEPYTLELLSDDAIGLLDALSIDTVHFVGLSMGGMIGQCLVLNHSDRLESLALCDTAAIIPEEAQSIWQERIDTVRGKGVQALVEPTLERWFTPSFLRLDSARVGVIRKQFLATSMEGYIGCLEAIRRLNFLDRLSEIRMPTLIIAGEDDPGAPAVACEAMHKRISNSRLVILPSARHLSNVEQPEAFNSALVSFLKDL